MIDQQIPPPKIGMLDKLSPSFFAGWQSRQVELVDRVLKYYKFKDKSKTEKNLCGVINF